MTDEDLARLLPPIPPDANKYTRGSLLVLAGSTRFPGAAVLAAKAAARAGAGYVTLAIPKPALAVAQAHLLSIPVIAAPATDGAFAADAWEYLRDRVTHLDAVVLGPGLTVTPSTSEFTMEVLRNASVPVLLDADALNILATLVAQAAPPERLTHASFMRQALGSSPSGAARILTPHAGELKRISDATRIADERQLARELDAILVAKGPETRVISPEQLHASTAGTPALAKAGTGDVLAGIIGSFIAQGVAPFDAAVLGVELHGRAAHVAEERLGRRAVCAEDVLDALPTVLRKLDALRAIQRF